VLEEVSTTKVEGEEGGGCGALRGGKEGGSYVNEEDGWMPVMKGKERTTC